MMKRNPNVNLGAIFGCLRKCGSGIHESISEKGAVKRPLFHIQPFAYWLDF